MLLRFQKSTKSSRWSASLLVAFVVVALTGSAFAKPEEPKVTGPLGSLDKELISKVVHDNRDQVRSCYEQAIAKAPVEGKLLMDWTIATTGAVKDVSASPSSTLKGEVVSCIVNAVSGWKFPAPKGGEVHVTYPFSFSVSAVDAH